MAIAGPSYPCPFRLQVPRAAVTTRGSAGPVLPLTLLPSFSQPCLGGPYRQMKPYTTVHMRAHTQEHAWKGAHPDVTQTPPGPFLSVRVLCCGRDRLFPNQTMPPPSGPPQPAPSILLEPAGSEPQSGSSSPEPGPRGPTVRITGSTPAAGLEHSRTPTRGLQLAPARSCTFVPSSFSNHLGSEPGQCWLTQHYSQHVFCLF